MAKSKWRIVLLIITNVSVVFMALILNGFELCNIIAPLITIYVLLPYIAYVMESGRFSQYHAILSQTAKERDKKYSVKSP
jgi:hypothetical protein